MGFQNSEYFLNRKWKKAKSLKIFSRTVSAIGEQKPVS
jgi:hypothetical protein